MTQNIKKNTYISITVSATDGKPFTPILFSYCMLICFGDWPNLGATDPLRSITCFIGHNEEEWSQRSSSNHTTHLNTHIKAKLQPTTLFLLLRSIRPDVLCTYVSASVRVLFQSLAACPVFVLMYFRKLFKLVFFFVLMYFRKPFLTPWTGTTDEK